MENKNEPWKRQSVEEAYGGSFNGKDELGMKVFLEEVGLSTKRFFKALLEKKTQRKA